MKKKYTAKLVRNLPFVHYGSNEKEVEEENRRLWSLDDSDEVIVVELNNNK